MISQALIQATLALLAGDATQLDGASFGLFTNDPDVNDPDLVKADFTPPTFTGYAPVVLAEADWTEVLSESGNHVLVGDPAPFSPSDAVGLPQIIKGMYMFNGSQLISGAYFSSPIILTAALQMFHATPAFGLLAGDAVAAEAAMV